MMTLRAQVALCTAVCTIPLGRLSESLSLSHAVAIACSALFQRRTQSADGEGGGGRSLYSAQYSGGGGEQGGAGLTPQLLPLAPAPVPPAGM